MNKKFLLLSILMLSGCATEVQVREAQQDQWSAIVHELRKVHGRLDGIEKRIYRVEADTNRLDATFKGIGIQGYDGNHYIGQKVQRLEPIQ